MPPARVEDYHEVVARNKHLSLAILFASQAGCIERLHEFAVRGRRYQIVEGTPSGGLRLPARAVVIVSLCPGDDIHPIVEWLVAQGLRQPDRVLFLHHPACDLVQQLAPWYQAFDHDPFLVEATEYPGKAGGQKRIGQWYNDWIYADAKGLQWPLSGGLFGGTWPRPCSTSTGHPSLTHHQRPERDLTARAHPRRGTAAPPRRHAASRRARGP